MKFRTRLIGAVTGVTIVTLGSAFSVVFVAENRSQQRQFDAAIRAEAREEAREAAAAGGARLVITPGPGPTASDVGPLTKYGVIYGPAGNPLDATPTFLGNPPAVTVLPAEDGTCFNLRFVHEHLRGVAVHIPGRPGFRLMLAAPRTDMDADTAFLRRAMLAVFGVAVVWAALVASWIVRRLTAGHNAIVAVSHRVAAGDLSARIGRNAGDAETMQLGHDIDQMIGRLEALIAAQQRFIAHAAHELRSPLTAIYGELSHALRRPRDAEAYRAAIEEALDSTRRLKLLADDLLTLARLGVAQGDGHHPVTRLTTEEIIGAAIRAAESNARAHGVTIHVCGAVYAVQGRSGDLARALRNLIDNAVWHAPRHSAVEIAVQALDCTVEIAVTDEGPGVPAAERARIFEPFYRGREEQLRDVPGAGLGLAIAREVLRAHAGEVYLADPPKPGTGARFVIRLPSA